MFLKCRVEQKLSASENEMQNLSVLNHYLIVKLCQHLYSYFSCLASCRTLGAINVPAGRSMTILGILTHHLVLIDFSFIWSGEEEAASDL